MKQLITIVLLFCTISLLGQSPMVGPLSSKCECPNKEKTYLFDHWTYETDDYKDEYFFRAVVVVSDFKIVVKNQLNGNIMDQFVYSRTAYDEMDMNDGDMLYQRIDGNEQMFLYVYNFNLEAFVLFNAYDSSEAYVFYTQ